MKNDLFITGCSGFVGKNLIEVLKDDYNINCFQRNSEIKIKKEVVIHLAGKAHDMKNTSVASEYYQVNTDLTIKVFDAFLASNSKVFITLSSVKALSDNADGVLLENQKPNPITHYGKSKLLAEQYIFSKEIPDGKRVYVLRPAMIHGPGNKGNLNLLYRLVKLGVPYPLAAFKNERSFLSIANLIFAVDKIINDKSFPTGVYHIADDETFSTRDLVELIGEASGKVARTWFIPRRLIKGLAKVGDIMHLPLNSHRLQKLTESYLVSNEKLKKALGVKHMPVSGKEGLSRTIKSFTR